MNPAPQLPVPIAVRVYVNRRDGRWLYCATRAPDGRFGRHWVYTDVGLRPEERDEVPEQKQPQRPLALVSGDAA